MLFRSEIWTYIIVTATTMLIWFWAAAATREQTVMYGRVQFEVAGAGQWEIEPDSVAVVVTGEGSALVTQSAEDVLRDGPITLELPAQAGTEPVDLADRLRNHATIGETGVAILGVEPGAVDVTVDEVRPYQAAVRAVIPGALTEGEVEIDPPTAQINLPSLQRQRLPDELVVEAVIDQSVIDRLEPDKRHSREVRLRLPDPLASMDSIVIDPEVVRLTFTLRSRIREFAIDGSVRVHLAGPPADFLEYDITLDPAVLQDVTVEAEAEVIRLLETREASVVAVLHLSNQDKEQAIRSKAVAYFEVLMEGWTRGVSVKARVGDSPDPPVIGLEITRR